MSDDIDFDELLKPAPPQNDAPPRPTTHTSSAMATESDVRVSFLLGLEPARTNPIEEFSTPEAIHESAADEDDEYAAWAGTEDTVEDPHPIADLKGSGAGITAADSIPERVANDKNEKPAWTATKDDPEIFTSNTEPTYPVQEPAAIAQSPHVPGKEEVEDAALKFEGVPENMNFAVNGQEFASKDTSTIEDTPEPIAHKELNSVVHNTDEDKSHNTTIDAELVEPFQDSIRDKQVDEQPTENENQFADWHTSDEARNHVTSGDDFFDQIGQTKDDIVPGQEFLGTEQQNEPDLSQAGVLEEQANAEAEAGFFDQSLQEEHFGANSAEPVAAQSIKPELSFFDHPVQSAEAPGDDFFSQVAAASQPSDPVATLDGPSEQPNPPPQADLSALWDNAFGDDELLVEPVDTTITGTLAMLGGPEETNQELAWGEGTGGDDFLTELKTTNANDAQPSTGSAGNEAEVSWDDAFADDDEFLSGFAAAASAEPSSQPAPAQPVGSTRQPLTSSRSYMPIQSSAPTLQTARSMSFHPQQLSSSFQAVPQPPTPTDSAAESSVRLQGNYHSPYDLPDDFVKPKPRPRPSATPQLGSYSPGPASGFQEPPRSTSLPPPVPGIQSSHSMQPTAPTQASPAKSNQGFFEDLPVVPRQRGPAPSGRYTPQASTPNLPPPGPSFGNRIPSDVPFGLAVGFPPNNVPSSLPTQPLSTTSSYAAPPRTSSYTQPPPIQSQIPAAVPPPTSHTLMHTASQPSLGTELRVPERLAPYADDQGSVRSATVPAVAPPSSSSRYSPAPPLKPTQTRHPSDPGAARAQLQTYAPRTSSPLTLQPIVSPEAPTSHPPINQHAPPHHRETSFNRYSATVNQSPLETVEENDSPANQQIPQAMIPVPSQVQAARQMTPPPPRSGLSSLTSSPRKRNNYVPLASPPDLGFAPPKRSQTSSPGAVLKASKSILTSMDRPASAQGALSPTKSRAGPMVYPSVQSVGSNLSPLAPKPNIPHPSQMIQPQDERASDPLQRWRGHPVFTWGGHGTVVTAFPTYLPRYVAGQALPLMQTGGGEFKVRNINTISPALDQLSKFPGPLKKNKKKELLVWLKSGVERSEGELRTQQIQPSLGSNDFARIQERIILWKVLSLLVEHDGVLDGKPETLDAVKSLLAIQEDTSMPPDTAALESAATILPDAPTPKELGILRSHLKDGQGEKAVWHAVDQRLWGPAMLIASTLDKDIWKQVIQEFVRKEVRDKALAALFQVFAGNWDESIDELVSVSARAGFQMVSTAAAPSAQQDGLAGLEKWRETLLLILNNRSPGDSQALIAIGRVLSSYGRFEAAHICFIFAGSQAFFGGADDPRTTFSLVGGDPTALGSDFGGDLEAILLSEVYEYVLSISPSPITPIPHLQAYKLYHAEVLTENGLRSDAQQYCETISSHIHSKTKASPYYNVALMQSVETLSKRLSEAPVDSSTSWKPSIDKVSSSLWGKFNSFVVGEDKTDTPNDSRPSSEHGQFKRFAGDTPPISAEPSVADLYGAYQSGAASVPSISSNSRYAPSNTYAPRRGNEHATQNSYGPGGQYQPRSSLESSRSSQDGYSRRSLEGHPLSPKRVASFPVLPPLSQQTPNTNGLSVPTTNGSGLSRPHSASPYHPQPVSQSSYDGYQPQPMDNANGSASYGYQSQAPGATSPYAPQSSYGQLGASEPMNMRQDESQRGNSGIQSHSPYESHVPSYEEPQTPGYEQPNQSQESSGYQPYSYQPYEPEPEQSEGQELQQADDEDNKAKKKSFMDDDDDDDLIARAAALKNSNKSKADQAADEAFRKAAAADAARPSAPTNRSSWLGGWFGKKQSGDLGDQKKPVKANLGEKSSFYFDPDLGKWVNKAGGATTTPGPSATPPPPRGTPPPPRNLTPTLSSGPPSANSLAQPPAPPPTALGGPLAPPVGARTTSMPLPVGGLNTPPPLGGGPPSRPPSRPATSMSNASDIDDLLGAPGPRTRNASGAKPKKRGGRYVDVMANKN
ncbi:hypothetical protein BT63DRAFT_437905 [Microthyrium microscopicum]|uniref:Protein transport protein sec16 n=1 Tax=Microthyrium microscopicum TaxID=703497 RepID=A0A6A6UKL1_9PEZI|nr:hypothetical protein BT63DRAFT_437905 [Microthyrium microscopicum]